MKNFTSFTRWGKKSVSLFLIANALGAAFSPIQAAQLTSLTELSTPLQQVIRQKRVTLSVKDQSLKNILKQIQQQTGIGFAFKDENAPELQRLTLSAKNQTVEAVLDELLSGKNYSYRLVNNTVTIQRSNSRPATANTNPVRTLSGTVRNAQKHPITGVTVLVKGTTRGASTDENGRFRLSVSEGDILTFTFVGLKSTELRIAGQSTLDVIMEEDVASIDDVVVNGFFERKKEGFAGTVTTIKREELQKLSTGNIFTTISALDAGFKITEDVVNGSNPNVIPEFTIRGKGSFLAGSVAPLFILDGFEVSAEKIFDMDVNLIQSITLLKDASAAILYGSRAANGVIVIETITPKVGKVRVSYDLKTTLGVVDLTGYDLMNASEKLEYERLAGLYDSDSKFGYDAQDQYYKRYKNVQEGVDTYWLSQPVQNSFSHAHSLYIEGGSDQLRYGIDAQYNGNSGVMKKSGRDRTGLGISLIYRAKDKVTLKNYVSYAYTHAYDSPYGSFSDYARMNPYDRPTDDNGNVIPLLLDGVTPNPLYDAQLTNRSFQNTEEFKEQLSVDWQIISGLRLRGQLSITKQNTALERYVSPFSSSYVLKTNYNEETNKTEYIPIEKRGELAIQDGKGLSFSSSFTLNYSNVFAERHLIYAGAGFEINTGKSNSHGFTATGFPDDRYSDPSFAIQYKENSTPASSESKNRALGIFANLNYIYDHRYFVDLSLRQDGSSRFGADRKWAPFYSMGGGWNINHEKFFPKTIKLEVLRIRYSYGITGNQEFSSYQAKTTFGYRTDRLYYTQIPALLLGYGNPDLKWQTAHQHNVGFDIALPKNRLKASFNYYRTRTEGMLTSITVAPSVGIPSNRFTSNLGKIENKGVEANLTGMIINDTRKDLAWNVTLQVAHNKNTLLKISNQLKNINAANNSDKFIPGAVYEEGQSMSAIKAVKSLGIDPTTGKEVFVKRDGTLTTTWDAADKILCGDTEPKIFGNISSNLYYRGWNLNLVFNYLWDADYYNQTLAQRVEGANPKFNADRRVLNDRWKTVGEHALYKNISDYETSYISTRFVQRENTMQLKSLSLSYDFRKELLKNIGLGTLRLSFYANDLIRLSTIKAERGTTYPFQRSFVFGVNVTL